MFNTGDKLIITMKENGVVEKIGVKVMEYDNGLLKIDTGGKPEVINVRSLCFIRAIVDN